jgi:large subunit ribosomal protein L24
MMTTERNQLSLRKDDLVEVIAGRDKGKTGRILAINPDSGRVTVEKVNMVKRHVKPSQKYPQGGILEKEVSIHYSNVLLMCPKCNTGRRHGMKLVEQKGKKGATGTQAKVRVCKKCGESITAAKA